MHMPNVCHQHLILRNLTICWPILRWEVTLDRENGSKRTCNQNKHPFSGDLFHFVLDSVWIHFGIWIPLLYLICWPQYQEWHLGIVMNILNASYLMNNLCISPCCWECMIFSYLWVSQQRSSCDEGHNYDCCVHYCVQ